MASSYVDKKSTSGRLALERLTRATWVLPRTLMNRLAGKADDDELYEKEIRRAFDNDDPTNFVEYVLYEAPNRPAAALLELTECLNELPIDTARRIEIDKSVVVLCDSIGSCERIFTSPVPLVYTRHTARFLMMWLLLLPLALYGSFVTDVVVEGSSSLSTMMISAAESVGYIFALALISFFLFGIEELAVTLEEPFSILPMQRFCDGIKASTEAMKDRALSLADR